MYLKLKVLCTVLLVYHLCQKRNLSICLMFAAGVIKKIYYPWFAVQYHVMSSKLPYQLLLTALLIIAVQSFSKTQLPTAVLDIVRWEDARRIDCNG